jgi:hypothetical protein
MAYRDNPPTRCTSCRRQEMTRLERLIEMLLGEDNTVGWFLLSGDTIRAIAVGHQPLTWYDRHTAQFEHTGDVIHLTRALRHVEHLGDKAA